MSEPPSYVPLLTLPVGPLGLPRQAGVPARSLLRPFGRHLGYGADPSRQVVVSWQVPDAVADPFVRIGTRPGEFGARIPAEMRPLVSRSAWRQPGADDDPVSPRTTTQYYLHTVLDQLLPDTTYYYVVGHRGHDPAGAGRLPGEFASFRTAPVPERGGAFSFTAFGDQGIGHNAVATANLAAALDPAFHLHLGDLSYANSIGSGETSDAYDPRIWDIFFVQNESIAARIPWMPAVGNHELEPWHGEHGYGGVRARFTMPDNAWPGSTGIYSWRYQNVGLICLDGNDVCYNTPANLDHTEGRQHRWLERRLSGFRADPTIDFVVVYLHQCTYSTCPGNGAELGAQEHWAPLFDRYQVDLVLSGHNHVYERTDPIRAGLATRPAPSGDTVDPVRDGTTYIVAGGGGDEIYAFAATDSHLGHESPNDEPLPMVICRPDGQEETVETAWSRVRYTGYCLLAVEVTPAAPGRAARMEVRSLTEDGILVDALTVRRS